MNNIEELKNLYQDKIEQYNGLATHFRRLVRKTNIMRGVSFVGGMIISIIAVNHSLAAAAAFGSLSMLFFFFFIKKNYDHQKSLTYNEALLRINESELKAINHDFSDFDGAADCIDKQHGFSYDLDIFGDNSIFQMVNRTVTAGGREKLSSKFKNPSTDINEILSIQEKTSKLENLIDARQEFMAYGIIFNDKKTPEHQPDFSGVETRFANSIVWKATPIVLALCNLAAIILSGAGLISPMSTILTFTIGIAAISLKQKTTNGLAVRIERYGKFFKKYEKLLNVIENNFETQYSCKHHISNALHELSQIAAMYGQRHNLMVIMFMEGLFGYDIIVNTKFEKWLEKYSGELSQWLDTAHEYDFLFSLANLKFNNPNWTFPKPVEGSFILEAINAGHPLISPAKIVKNDIQFSNCNFLTILTGANMAGKSTYLRTIGINLVLAQIGAVVCADSFRFSPTKIMTSIRTNDSVQDNESYFFAELKRLHKIVERLENGETLFIIVDEMLRGTNSMDKHDGSQKFIEKLLKYKCYGIFATHDIDLGNMRETYPQNVNARCFEISFEGDRLVFDYKLKDGISQNLNASYLMRKMGIIE